MDNSGVDETTPTAVNVTVRESPFNWIDSDVDYSPGMARKKKRGQAPKGARPREYLTEREVERLMDAARENRWGHRDATAILLAYRHGLRASELVAIRWDDIEFQTSKLHVRRAKGGQTSVHPLGGKELRALRRLQRETPDGHRTVHVFVSERLAPLSVAGYQRMVARAGEAAGFSFLIHSHMLRHSTGYKLANDGRDTRTIQEYLGHRSITSTARYTALSSTRFKNLWRD
jgi:type 1 fimbriae regulatory protein FimB/type 1 fimbriae regulatory protein FimE